MRGLRIEDFCPSSRDIGGGDWSQSRRNLTYSKATVIIIQFSSPRCTAFVGGEVMSFTTHTKDARRAMLDAIGVASAEALFAEIDTSQSGRITVAKFDLFAVVRTITAVRARPPQLLLRGLGLQNVFVCRSTDMRTVRHSRAR